MISSLPSDLVMEILSRVPLNSMREVRLTCKKWNVLSKTQSFRKMHIGKASSAVAKKGESQIITVMNNNLYLTSILFVDGEPSFEHKGKLNEQVKVSHVYHCEGLLLCILEDDPRFLVWNPYLMEKRWIQSRYHYNPYYWENFTYALGYEDKKDKSSRSCCVKLLRFTDYSTRGNQFSWYEMYDFESGLWTTLDVTPHWHIFRYNRGVSLKGNTYWCASEKNLDDDDSDDTADSIICFDFTKERFGKLLPLPFTDGLDHYEVVLSCVREEKLAVLVNHHLSKPYELDIWITTKIDAQEVSWSKFLRVESQFGNRVPFLSEGFFIDEEKKIAMGFKGSYYKRFRFNIIGDAEYFRKLDLLREPAKKNIMAYVCAFIPSLLQIEQPAGGGERKQQRELEKRRWNENMSRLTKLKTNVIIHRDFVNNMILGQNINTPTSPHPESTSQIQNKTKTLCNYIAADST